MKSLERLQVRVACVAADAEYLLAVDLPDGATVGDALQASRIEERVSDLCGVPVIS